MNINRDFFEGWLRSKDEHEVVGAANDSCNCPLATYMNKNRTTEQMARHVHHMAVSRSMVKEIDRSGDLINCDRLPEWATAFVVTVDTDFKGEHITAAMALQVLDAIR